MNKAHTSCSNLSLSSLCKEKRMKLKVHLFKNHHLEINVDKLESHDWASLNKSLKINKLELHGIKAKSKVATKNVHKNVKIFMSTKKFKDPGFSNFVEALVACMIKSELFANLCLDGLPLSSKNVEVLVQGIDVQRNLQNLDLTNCELSCSDIRKLCEVISRHTRLNSINFSGCGLDFEGAKYVSDVIRKQKLARYGETWKQSLRYRQPHPEIVPGLVRISLNDNPKIRDEGFEAIIHELQDDLWIKAVDFQNCGLTIQSSNCATELFQTNNTLCILDVRKNNLPCQVVKNIINCLKINNSTSDNTKFDWLDTSSSQIKSGTTKNNSNCPQLYTKKCKDLISIKSEIFSSELQRTRFMLRKVSSSLVEERAKRRAIEEKSCRFEEKLDEIRKYVEKMKLKKNMKGNSKEKISKDGTVDKKIKLQVYKKPVGEFPLEEESQPQQCSSLLLILPARSNTMNFRRSNSKQPFYKKLIDEKKLAYIKINDVRI